MAGRARGMRGGGAAALFAARMTDEVEPTEAEIEELTIEGEPDENLEIQVEAEHEEDDEPAVDYSHVESEPEDDEPAVEAPDALADLQKQLATLQAEREADKARRAVDDEATELRQHRDAIAGGIKRAQSDLVAAKSVYAKAAAAGDWDRAADAQASMASITTDIKQFEEAAEEVKSAVEAFNRGVRRKPAITTTQPAGDPFDQAVATMTPKSQEWCKTNKADLIKSPARAARAQAANLEATEKGIALDSPEYFAHMNKAMGYQMPNTKQPRPTGQARVAAPAGGRASTSGGGKVEVKLSRDEIAMAKTLFPGDANAVKRYAANKAEIIKNGQDRSRGGPTYSNVSQNARR